MQVGTREDGGENRKQGIRPRMLSSVPTNSTANTTRGVIAPVVDVSEVGGGGGGISNGVVVSSPARSFVKDVRKVNIGDCALFKPPQESPPFIGIIRSLGPDRDHNLQLGVNWIYRPADVEHLTGVAIEAAPNEVFYSFHRDEIPAASLLHPCKVAFLPKGAELPSGVSSFVCRRLFDTTTKRLWWLTDKDYTNDRQEEVDQLLRKTQCEMHATAQQQQGGRSPKPVSSPMSTSQLKHSPDSVQNSTSAFSSQAKGKKRERSDQGSDPVKRERSSKADEGDSSFLRSEGVLKSEIAKITEKGGLVDSESVERLVQLMQPDKCERRIDLNCRSLLAGVLTATDKVECLNRFVQLKGLSVLDEWVQEAHKGKIGGSSSPRDHDRSVEDFLLTVLRALDKLPVNLNSLQTCNIGKSVNHLRSHRNSEIQKKARSLVDTWKKRVEAEMNINDSRSGTNQAVTWPARMRNEVSHGGNRHTSASDAVTKNSPSQLSSAKSASAKFIGEAGAKASSGLASPANVKLPSSPASTSARDGHFRNSVISTCTELPSAAVKDEKSSSSSQSHTNSQCSSDHAKNMGPSVKEDGRSSNSGSTSLNKSSGTASRHRKAANGLQGVAASTVQREGGLNRNSSLTRISVSEKLSQPLTSEKSGDVPVADNNNHKLIVKISNRGRSPAQINGGSVDDPSANSRASSPVVPEKHGQSDRSSKGKSDSVRNNSVSDVNAESWQCNDLKDGVAGSNEGERSSATVPDYRRCQSVDETGKLADGAKATVVSKSEMRSRKSNDPSLSSINALIESCVNFSEANVPMSAGDDAGMNLLASVAAGEISKSGVSSPAQSLPNTSVADEACKDFSAQSKPNGDVDVSLGSQNQSTTAADVEPQKLVITSGASVAHNEEQDGSMVCGKDLPTADTSTRVVRKSDGSGPVTSVSPSTDLAGSEVAEQGHESKPAIRSDSDACTSDRSQVAVNCVAMKEKSGDAPLKEESLIRCSRTATAASASTLVDKNEVKDRAKIKAVVEKLPAAVTSSENMARIEKVPVSCINNLLPGQLNDVKEDDMDAGCSRLLDEAAHPQLKQEKDSPPVSQKQDDVVLESGSLAQNSQGDENDLGKKDVPAASDSQMSSLATAGHGKELQSDSKVAKLAAGEGEEAEQDRPSGAADASSPAAGSSVTDGKLEFDLNEGPDADDGNEGEIPSTATPGCPSSVLISPVPSFSVASASGSLPTSVTVTAAAKGAFVPPDDLLRNRGELGWKGSAATSAFRPAEPRKVLEMPSSASSAHVSSEVSNGKQGRVRLEIDLNVADDPSPEDLGCPINDVLDTRDNCRANGPTGGTSGRSGGGGLDLDLNKVDGAPELFQLPSTSHKFEMPPQTARLSSSSALSNSDSTRRDFDLNNGPAADEGTVESSSFNQHGRVNIPPQPPVGFRINSSEMGSLSSWYPAGNTFSAMSIPAPLPDREQPFPIVGTGGGPHRLLGGPAGSMPFNPDMYRGSVLSSSPAVPFAATPFQYPVFPFGTSFPLPSSSLPGGSPAFMDLSSGGRLCIPAVPSQLVGGATNMSSQYPRPYVVSLSDVSSSVAVDNARKWGRQGLDLNAGPGGADVEGRDEALPIPPRPVSAMGSFALTEEQSRMYSMAGGVLKRKEPEGGWDSERLSYKQPSWQ